MKTLFHRWTLLIILTIINVSLFDPKDWQFWVIAALIGMACSPLFKKEIE